MRRSLLAAVSLIVLAAPAMAQETGTPVFLGPDRLFQKSAFGISMSDPGSGIAIEGYYRMASNPKADFGFRLGFADPGGDAAPVERLNEHTVRERVEPRLLRRRWRQRYHARA